MAKDNITVMCPNNVRLLDLSRDMTGAIQATCADDLADRPDWTAQQKAEIRASVVLSYN
jgi:hypothetical protein